MFHSLSARYSQHRNSAVNLLGVFLSIVTYSLYPVYTMQPVVKAVGCCTTGCAIEQPAVCQPIGCLYTRYTIQPVVQPVVKPVWFDNRLYRVNGALQTHTDWHTTFISWVTVFGTVKLVYELWVMSYELCWLLLITVPNLQNQPAFKGRSYNCYNWLKLLAFYRPTLSLTVRNSRPYQFWQSKHQRSYHYHIGLFTNEMRHETLEIWCLASFSLT